MRSLIFIIILIFGILLYVKTQPLDDEPSAEYFIEPPHYSDLLTYLSYQKNNQYENDVVKPRKEPTSFFDRRMFQSDNIHSKHIGRPAANFGRKSHWDTFFGRK